MRRPLATFIVTVAALVAAVLLRWLLDPVLHDHLPLITLFGILVPAMLIAAVLSEVVFTWQGLGSLLIGAMQNRDYAVVEGVILLIGLVCIVANALVDVSYALLDPRIRYS